MSSITDASSVSAAAAAAKATTIKRQQANERSFERLVENRVDYRINDAGRVAEPEQRLKETLVEVARVANPHGKIDDEK